MKTLRNELSAIGRHDVLERVMAYRGGKNNYAPFAYSGVSDTSFVRIFTTGM